MEMEKMMFKAGQKLKVRVKINNNCAKFSINIGQDADNIALHFDPRFNYGGCVNVLVLNHKRGGTYGAEQKDSNFPFVLGKESKFYIKFNRDTFEITLSDGSMITFPNHLGDVTYDHFHINGDAELVGIRITS